MNQMAAHIDLLPTLSQLCGAPLPKDRKIDGRSFVPALEGKTLSERVFSPIGPESFLKNTITLPFNVAITNLLEK